MTAEDAPSRKQHHLLQLAHETSRDTIEGLGLTAEVDRAVREADRRLRKATRLLRPLDIDLPALIDGTAHAHLLSFMDETATHMPYRQARTAALDHAPADGTAEFDVHRRRHILITEAGDVRNRTLCRYYSGYGAESGSWWFSVRDMDVKDADFVAYLLCDGAGEVGRTAIVSTEWLRRNMQSLEPADDGDTYNMYVERCDDRFQLNNDRCEANLTPSLDIWDTLWA